MSVILVMIPAALLLAAIGIAAFIFAARSGQFDDLDTPPLRAVFDDDDDVVTRRVSTDQDERAGASEKKRTPE